MDRRKQIEEAYRAFTEQYKYHGYPMSYELFEAGANFADAFPPTREYWAKRAHDAEAKLQTAEVLIRENGYCDQDIVETTVGAITVHRDDCRRCVFLQKIRGG